MKKSFLSFCFLVGLCFSLLWACSGNVSNVNSFEQASQVLQNEVLPKISVTNNVVSDQVAQNYSVKNIVDPLPPIDKYPIYGASPSNDPNITYLEIFTSPDKGNAEKEDERWLVDVAEKFNAQNLKTESGKKIQVGIRNLPSGISQRMIAEKVAKPAAYTPSNQLWIAMLKSAGVETKEITPELVPNQPGILLSQKAKQDNFGSEEVTFDKLLDAIVAGKIAVGYTNPYTSSSGLNLLYTIFWRAAGHQTDGKPLTVSDLVFLTEILYPKLSRIFEPIVFRALKFSISSLFPTILVSFPRLNLNKLSTLCSLINVLPINLFSKYTLASPESNLYCSQFLSSATK
jgi:Ca-activated chloride channel family protein